MNVTILRLTDISVAISYVPVDEEYTTFKKRREVVDARRLEQ